MGWLEYLKVNNLVRRHRCEKDTSDWRPPTEMIVRTLLMILGPRRKLIVGLTKPTEEFEKLSKELLRFKKTARLRKTRRGMLRRSLHAASFILPAKRRAEIIGDFYETRARMQEEGYGRTAVFIVSVLKGLLLFLVALRLRITDFYPARRTDD